MKNKVCIFVCNFLSAEVESVLHASNYENIKLVVYQEKCAGHAFDFDKIEAMAEKEHENFTKFIFIGSSCLADTHPPRKLSRNIEIIPLELCFELVLNRETLTHYIRNGYYIVTNGWLKNYQQHIDAWGFDEVTAKVFFGESMQKILLLDTGLPGDCTAELNNLSSYMGLPYEILPVGISHCKNIIDNIIAATEAEIQRNNANEHLAQISREKADYSVIFSQLQNLVDQTDENTIIQTIFSLLNILFAPLEICFEPVINGEKHAPIFFNGDNPAHHRQSDNCFEIDVAHNRELLGKLNIFEIKFPEFKRQYQEMGNVISHICGLAIANARKYNTMLEQKKQLQVYSEQLDEVNKAKDKFFSIIAHDLRSPFNGFIGLTEIMADEENDFSPDEMHTLTTQLHNSASAVYTLLENLLDWAKLQIGTLTPAPEDILFKQLLDDEINLLAESARRKNITIIVNVQENIHLYADRKMIGTVLRNLLSNSIKFTPRGGSVTITASRNDDRETVIKVRDNGIGMNTGTKEKIFLLDADKGRRGTENEPSSGLGLLLCKEFVEKHGGKIQVESSEDTGSAFSFSIPALPQL
ncbi:MAG: HAMP domain-containing sensor histidine kinase [Victivallaceae bacterium]